MISSALFMLPLLINFIPYIMIPGYLQVILTNGMPKGGPLGLTTIVVFINNFIIKSPSIVGQVDFLSKIAILVSPFFIIKYFGKLKLAFKILGTLLLFFIFSPTIHIFYLMPLLPWIYFLKIKSLYYIWLPVFWWATTTNGLPGLRGWHYFTYPVYKLDGEPIASFFANSNLFHAWNSFIVSLVIIIMLLVGFWELVGRENA